MEIGKKFFKAVVIYIVMSCWTEWNIVFCRRKNPVKIMWARCWHSVNIATVVMTTFCMGWFANNYVRTFSQFRVPIKTHVYVHFLSLYWKRIFEFFYTTKTDSTTYESGSSVSPILSRISTTLFIKIYSNIVLVPRGIFPHGFNLYIYDEEMFLFVCLFVNHVKTTERINMGLRPYNAKSFVDGHRLFF